MGQPLTILAALFTLAVPAYAADDEALCRRAESALESAVRFFHTDVAMAGGYLWRYSADLKLREGEGKVPRTVVWVQPPGTPTVGQAYLDAYRLSRKPYLLQASRDAAHALVRGQLQSGGWDYRIEFDAQRRHRYAYRADGTISGRNMTTLDDNTTQAAVRFLIVLDLELEGRDPSIRQSVHDAMASLINAQYPNGAWPQRFEAAPDPSRFPVKRASYPSQWPRQHPRVDYREYYTFNDNTIADMVDLMFMAWKAYDNAAYKQAALNAGRFILLAQMPEPQPGWAQQYNRDMHPAWARRFEPPAITGGESRGVIETLFRLYRETGDEQFLGPVEPALRYYRGSRLSDGRLARFYELRTNRPLYFTRKYALTYEDDDLPTHYAFKTGDWVDRLDRELRALRAAGRSTEQRTTLPRITPPRITESLRKRTRDVIEQQDKRGAWVERGRMRYQGDEDETDQIIECRTFVRNIVTLSNFVAAHRQR